MKSSLCIKVETTGFEPAMICWIDAENWRCMLHFVLHGLEKLDF